MPRSLPPAPKRLLLGGIAVFLLMAATITEASECGPGRTVLNSVTVSYEDAGGDPQTPQTATACVVVKPLAVAASSPASHTATRAVHEGGSATPTTTRASPSKSQ